jgi:hypothetical protein
LAHWLDSELLRESRIIGPKGTASLMQNLERAYWDDIRIRYLDEKNPMEGIAIAPSEFDTRRSRLRT